MSLQVAFDFVPAKTRAEAEFRAGRDLPDGEPQLIEEGRRTLVAYHHAVMACENIAAEAARTRYAAIAIKMNGGSQQGMMVEWHSDSLGGGVRLERALAAVPGKIPMHGQLGKFIVAVNGCRAIIEVTGGLLRNQYHEPVEVRALDWDRPFISDTGFLSCYLEDPKPDETVKQLTARMIKQEITTQINWTNGKRVARKKGLEKITKGGGRHVEVYYCDECYEDRGERRIFPVDDGDVWHHQGDTPGSIDAELDAAHQPYCENGPEEEWIEEPVGPPKDDPDWEPGGWIHSYLIKHPAPACEDQRK